MSEEDHWTITEKGHRFMNLTKDERWCDSCQKTYPKKLDACPHCGYKPKGVRLAPKPGTPMVPRLYKKEWELRY